MAAITAAAFAALLAACPVGVPGPIAQGLVTHESGLETLAIGDNTTKRPVPTPATLADAVAQAKRLVAQGHNIDAGLLQINSANWSWLGLTADSVFDPQTNVCAGARVYAEAYAAETRTLCRYNTGKPDCTNGYPDKVRRAAGAPVTASPAPQPAPPPSWDPWATPRSASLPVGSFDPWAHPPVPTKDVTLR
jgi:type IV secretion system protein VirB1